MKNFLSLLIFLIISLASQSQSKDELLVRNAMLEQERAWNAGNIEKFMETYWNSDSLMFIGKSGITYGWQNTFNNYKKGYPDTVSMGKLNFEILHIKRLSVMYFTVVGKWALTRSIGNVGGHFTLLFKKIKNKWLIVSDHTS